MFSLNLLNSILNFFYKFAVLEPASPCVRDRMLVHWQEDTTEGISAADRRQTRKHKNDYFS